MTPDPSIGARAEAVAEDYIDREEEHEEGEEEAPSHLPLAPPSELCDTSTTVDPSYIISLIRQLLPRDAEKQDTIRDCNSTKQTLTTEAIEDFDSCNDLTMCYVYDIECISVDSEKLPSSNGDNGTHQGFGKEERTGVVEDSQTEDSETKDPWEECGCILWDLSANKTHAEFMVDNLLLEVLLANLQVSQSIRVTEICLGIIGNLACHDDLSSSIVSKNGLIQTVVQQLFLDDATCLSETFRIFIFVAQHIVFEYHLQKAYQDLWLLAAGLQSSRFDSWAEVLLPDDVLLRVLWIIGNTLNSVLLEKSIDFLLIIANNQDVSNILLQPLIRLGFPDLVASLLAGELRKSGDENKLERSSILDPVLGLIEALSTHDNYSQDIISNGELLPLVCGVVKLPDKIEVANSCISAVVIIANLLEDELASQFSQDFSFLEGMLDILAFVTSDPQARNAFWCIMTKILGRVQENDISISTLQQFASLFADKSKLIKDDIKTHTIEDLGESQDVPDGHKSNAATASVS